MNNKPDRRNFDRFPITFSVEVAAKDSEGKKYQENTVLKDISGGGARFITQQADKYFLGQSLELTIHLPDSDEVKARMRGKATVIRLDPSSNSMIDGKSQTVSIAVKLDTPLYFERDDVKMQGSSE
jgi:c-di-GMP-binding flagellar brake protein YcgR